MFSFYSTKKFYECKEVLLFQKNQTLLQNSSVFFLCFRVWRQKAKKTDSPTERKIGLFFGKKRTGQPRFSSGVLPSLPVMMSSLVRLCSARYWATSAFILPRPDQVSPDLVR